MAASSETAAPRVEAATSELGVLKLILEESTKTNKKLAELKDVVSYVFEKVSNIESRQSLTSGLENDAVRAVSQYATAESSALPEAAFKKAFDLSKTSEPTHTYYKTFYEKDMRRCEYQLLMFFEHMIEGKSYLFEADKQHSTGEAIKAAGDSSQTHELRLQSQRDPEHPREALQAQAPDAQKHVSVHDQEVDREDGGATHLRDHRDRDR